MSDSDAELTPEMTSEKAAALCLWACLGQIERNRRVALDTDDPEGPHQLRVGLRKLRTALRLFRPLIGCPEATRLSGEARDIGRAVGHTRDLDVFATELLPELGRDLPEDAAAEIRRGFEAERVEERERLRGMLRGERMESFLRDLDAFIRRRGWIVPEDFDQTERLAEPVGGFAGPSLAARWKKTAKLARHLTGPDDEKRHEFRKDLKKLRYSVDFLRPVLDPKTMKPFRKRLKKLQDSVGILNDVATAHALVEEARTRGFLKEHASDQLTEALGRYESRTTPARNEAAKLWRALAAAPLPWDPRRGKR